MAQMVQKKLVTLNINVYSGQSGEPWSKIEELLHYNGNPYILEIPQTDLLERNHNNRFSRHFQVQKTFELLTCKYYWPKMKPDVVKYVLSCDICMSSIAQRHKFHGSLQSFLVPHHKWKDFSIDFVTGLPKSKNWRRVEYDSIFVIIDQLTKMVHYEPVLITLDAK